jgi:bifunctional non-homologous end joining protein LigD
VDFRLVLFAVQTKTIKHRNIMPTLVEESLDRTTLYYREGSSDKIYQCAIEPAGTRFVVNFAYGRRGSTLNTGTKTNVPVDWDDAKRIYDKLVKEKTSKGYTPGPNGTPYYNSPKAERFTGLLPRLLNPIEEAEMNRLLTDDQHCMQEKFDGRRLLVQKQGTDITGINKKGLVVGLPESVVQAAQCLPGDFVVDGECIGDNFFVFDLLTNHTDLRVLPYRQRLVMLYNLIASAQQRFITLVATAFTPEEKNRLLQQLRSARKEGVVFKLLTAAYTPGRPNSGGPQLKHKFYATLSAVVAKINAQRSVEIRLLGDDGWQPAGNVTIPANHSVPQVGQVVEIRYLYAFKESGVLYQPFFLGLRNDVDTSECVATQLKFKAEEEAC